MFSQGIFFVAFWFGINGLIFMALVAHVMRQRNAANVWTGDGGEESVIRALRGQAVFLEYAPVCLLGLAILAMIDAPFWAIHLLGGVLTGGQLLHAIYVLRPDGANWLRVTGEQLSLAALSLCGVCLLALALIALG
jgi:uncharacterized protein